MTLIIGVVLTNVFLSQISRLMTGQVKISTKSNWKLEEYT